MTNNTDILSEEEVYELVKQVEAKRGKAFEGNIRKDTLLANLAAKKGYEKGKLIRIERAYKCSNHPEDRDGVYCDECLEQARKEGYEEGVNDTRINLAAKAANLKDSFDRFCDKANRFNAKRKTFRKEAEQRGAEQERERIKKNGYWTEDEGKKQITYRIEVLEYPHDNGCEGVMCYCSSRARKKLKEQGDSYE